MGDMQEEREMSWSGVGRGRVGLRRLELVRTISYRDVATRQAGRKHSVTLFHVASNSAPAGERRSQGRNSPGGRGSFVGRSKRCTTVQFRKCSGDVSLPHPWGYTVVCLSQRWQPAKSPCPVLAVRSSLRAGLDRRSSGGACNFVGGRGFVVHDIFGC